MNLNDQTLDQILRSAVQKLKQYEVNAPHLSAEVIIAYVLNITRLDVLTEKNLSLSPAKSSRIISLLNRLIAGEPLAYIVGVKEFFGHEFFVSPDVLIPRPETEKIIEIALDFFGLYDQFVLADICTGSGNLVVSLAEEFPKAKLIASDLSYKSLKLASKNISLNNLDSRTLLVQSNLGQYLRSEKVDLLVANPPYLSADEMKFIDCSISRFEPESALLGGVTGFEIIERLLNQSYDILVPGGLALIEVGGENIYQFKEVIEENSIYWQDLFLYKDDRGYDRVLLAKKL